jgi:FAD:protein FMN transferase
MADAGYDASYSLAPKKLHKPPQWEGTLDGSANTLIVKTPVLLDFGAAGKGYLVDILAEILTAQTIDYFCIDAGGDIRCHTPQPLRIGLEHPDDSTQAIGVATVTNGALCGSAGNRRAWGDYHHIINPQTLASVQRIKAVWVTAADALTADGLTTALFFTDASILHKHFDFAHCLVYSDNTMQYSADFPAEFFR